jgi:hypothetical protein
LFPQSPSNQDHHSVKSFSVLLWVAFPSLHPPCLHWFHQFMNMLDQSPTRRESQKHESKLLLLSRGTHQFMNLLDQSTTPRTSRPAISHMHSLSNSNTGSHACIRTHQSCPCPCFLAPLIFYLFLSVLWSSELFIFL